MGYDSNLCPVIAGNLFSALDPYDSPTSISTDRLVAKILGRKPTKRIPVSIELMDGGMCDEIHLSHIPRPSHITFTSMARMDIEVGDGNDHCIIRNVIIGPSGEALLLQGTTLPLNQMIEIEKIAQVRYTEALHQLFHDQC
jgi:hypothetical protein